MPRTKTAITTAVTQNKNAIPSLRFFTHTSISEGTRTIPDRCSDKNGPNHNPHKLEKE